MDLLSDATFLARLQFCLVVVFHYIYVPMSIGGGLFVAISQTRAYKTGDPKDEQSARFWVRIFALTFTIGVATGITEEFSFGTNWADYSRFVGDIFGSPLAAEALLAFFLESTFLGVLLFGRGKVGKKFYVASGWLVWVGSLLSALWIIIANSWMQTPAGYEIVETDSGTKAVLTDFAEAVFNPQTIPSYLHTMLAVVMFGALATMGIAAFYHLRGRNEHFVSVTMKTGTIVLLIATVLQMPVGHMQACTVVEEQPTKLAAMEGAYEAESMPMYLFGYVDTDNETVVGIGIPGFTSFLASWDFSTEYPGLNDLEEENPGSTPDDVVVQLTFQSYHLMILMFGVICIALILALLMRFTKVLDGRKWPWKIMCFLWIGPLLAIQGGWMTAEFGRQPWIVYGELLTEDGVSQAVGSGQLVFTIIMFVVIYALIAVAFIRLIKKFIVEGPEHFALAEASAGDGAVDDGTGGVSLLDGSEVAASGDASSDGGSGDAGDSGGSGGDAVSDDVESGRDGE